MKSPPCETEHVTCNAILKVRQLIRFDRRTMMQKSEFLQNALFYFIVKKDAMKQKPKMKS